jgi:ribonuclease VapC
LIAVDTSALVAVILKEPRGPACLAALDGDAELVISAGTLTEALIVARGRDISEEMQQLIDAFAFNVIPVTDASARRAAAAYEVWGRGVHPAALNMAIALLTRLRKRTIARCCLSATISPKPTCKAL